ncbi:hypothetical protein PYCCODRAFT_616986 [Trametes coccinea BRFM310]|uniref:Uncharacterized protein n=1 Tax=Trametes coccinea (strain BRFM310) TaxID=1353009 RepID=A0A1Y2J240_TRAC3|nr:hypothetical protein PYCCODRAFT_616986 [Trametes coccinea BRFM310]
MQSKEVPSAVAERCSPKDATSLLFDRLIAAGIGIYASREPRPTGCLLPMHSGRQNAHHRSRCPRVPRKQRWLRSRWVGKGCGWAALSSTSQPFEASRPLTRPFQDRVMLARQRRRNTALRRTPDVLSRPAPKSSMHREMACAYERQHAEFPATLEQRQDPPLTGLGLWKTRP